MPSYDYVCPSNGQRVSVRHSFSQRLETWQQLCEQAEMAIGETDPDAKVERVITGGHGALVRSRTTAAPKPPPGCPPRGCGQCMLPPQ